LVLQHVAGDTDNIQSASVVMYEREFFHVDTQCTEPGKMQYPVNGRAWKDFDTKYLDFAAEPRNVRLGLAADGFNSFGNLSQSYIMWPVILTTYNLPP
ncbi:hypothetical protein Tco_1374836, partial [Tanacetum coccineum]